MFKNAQGGTPRIRAARVKMLLQYFEGLGDKPL